MRESQEPTRHDLEFMGRMLGILPVFCRGPMGHVEACPACDLVCESWEVDAVPCDADRLAGRILEGMADPIANTRAQQRIGELLMQCEQVEVFADRDERAGYRIPPLDPRNYEHSPRHFSRDN